MLQPCVPVAALPRSDLLQRLYLRRRGALSVRCCHPHAHPALSHPDVRLSLLPRPVHLGGLLRLTRSSRG
eukprot:6567097-Prymnesium_polylepis.1